jgi:hypothetical protein
MQYTPLEHNNNNIKHSGMVLRSNGMLLSHFKRSRDAIPPHPTPPQPLVVCGIDYLVCQNEFFLNNHPDAKENDEHALDFAPNLSRHFDLP